MSEASRLVDELTRAIEGDPWHGSSVSAILRDVSAETAAAKPSGGAHSIWEILLHMTGWTREVARRLDGHAPAEPAEGDWPSAPAQTSDHWRRDVAALLDAHRRVLEKAGALSDERLFAPPPEHRDGPVGSGVSFYVLLHGLSQHHAYHAGQIALLKKGRQGSR
jgi:uncharacterized damage-inducible protein DinB